MSIRYALPPDDLSWNPWISDGSDDGWWAGVQKCAATVALAATLAISAASTAQASQQITWGASQDDPVGIPANFLIDDEPWGHKLYNPNLRVYSTTGDGQQVTTVDEDYWQNPVSPVVYNNLYQFLYIDRDDIPTGLRGLPEEDFWQNPVPSVSNPPFVPQQFTFDVQDSAGSLSLVADEDYWFHLDPETEPFPVWYWIDDSYVVTPTSFSPDEDYWQSKTLIPTQKVYGRGGGSRSGTVDDEPWSQQVSSKWDYQVTLWLDENTTIPQPLNFDEDFWQNPVVPVAYYPVPLVLRDDDIWVPPAAPISLPFDEEFWFNPVASIEAYPVPISFRDDDILVPAVAPSTLPFDEETWQQQLSAVPNNAITLWVDDSTSTAIPLPIPDEDLWQNSVLPVVAQNAIPQYWNFDNQEPASSLYGLDDELFWTNPTPPVLWTFGKIYLPDTNDDAAGFFASPIDEVYWQNPVAPVQSVNYIKLPLLPDPEEIPANTLSGQPDDDYWQNPVPPVAASLGRIYAPDFDDIPATGLKGQPDEDYWINPVAPVASYPVPFVYTDREEIPANTLYGVVEEEPYQKQTPAGVFSPVYYWIEDETPSTLSGQPDEDYWQNSVPAIASYPVPRVFTDDEIIVPQPPIAFDEDFWKNSVAPIAASNYVSFPILPDPEEIPAGSLIPPAPPNPCPCSGIPNIPKDRVYDIVLCDQGFVDHVHVWLACIFAQPGSLLAQHMGSSIVTLYVYGPQAIAFAEARQFVNHNMGTM